MDINLVLLDTVRNRLADEFNSQVSLIASRYGIEAFSIDRFDVHSSQYCEARIDIEAFEFGADVPMPLMFCYLITAEQTNETKFTTFSGDVILGMDIMFSVPTPEEGEQPYAGWRQLEGMAMCAEAALLECFNAAWAESCSYPLEYNGEIAFEKSPIVSGGQNYRKVLSARLTWGIHGQ